MALYHFLCLYSFIIIIIDPFNSTSLASTLNTTSLPSGSTVENKSCQQLCQWDVYFDCVSHRKDVSLYDQTLHLYGKNLPENWTSNFTIEIGGMSCQVLRILSGHLTCNITDINLFSRQLYSQSSTSTEASTMNTPWVKSTTERKETTTLKIQVVIIQAVQRETNVEREITKPNYHQITDHFISYHVTVHSPQCSQSLGVLNISTASLTGRRPLYVGLVICTTILVTIVLLIVAVSNKDKITLVKQRLQECKNKRLESLALMKINMKEFILKPKDITIGKLIGSGHFGCVYEGVLKTNDCCLKVAVKTVQDFSSGVPTIKAFIQEAVIMKHLQHPNVLQLIGLVEKQPGIPYVLLPYMEKGDLLTYVRTESVTLSLHEVLKFGADIASGMAYLSSLQFVHRDLAARNCMLDGLNTVKVADFGLCRDICEKGYYSSDNKKMLPIRWMAIESIEHGSYTTKSDVWSLGVVLWELLTRGLTPYPGVDSWDIINYLRYRRLPAPFFCPEQLYFLMMLCWAKTPHIRPTFNRVHSELLRMLSQRSVQFSEEESKPDPQLTLELKKQDGETMCVQDANIFIQRDKNMSESEATKSEPSYKLNEMKPGGLSAILSIEWEENSNTSKNKEEDDSDNSYLNLLRELNTKMVDNVDITLPDCQFERDLSECAIKV